MRWFPASSHTRARESNEINDLVVYNDKLYAGVIPKAEVYRYESDGDVVTLFTSGKVNRRWKALRWQRRIILRCYQRLPSGRWEGPVDLTPEFTIDEYRSLAGFSVPPYAPENFVPLAFSDHDKGTVKLLKVPLPLTLGKDK